MSQYLFVILSAMLSLSIAAEEITINPKTKQGTIKVNGNLVPLWDGIHELNSGKKIIVKSGVVTNINPSLVKTAPLRTKKDKIWQGRKIGRYSPCETLFKKVCGQQKQCENDEMCQLAEQALALEEKERAKNWDRGYMTEMSGDCLASLKERHYPECQKK